MPKWVEPGRGKKNNRIKFESKHCWNQTFRHIEVARALKTPECFFPEWKMWHRLVWKEHKPASNVALSLSCLTQLINSGSTSVYFDIWIKFDQSRVARKVQSHYPTCAGRPFIRQASSGVQCINVWPDLLVKMIFSSIRKYKVVHEEEDDWGERYIV